MGPASAPSRTPAETRQLTKRRTGLPFPLLNFGCYQSADGRRTLEVRRVRHPDSAPSSESRGENKYANTLPIQSKATPRLIPGFRNGVCSICLIKYQHEP